MALNFKVWKLGISSFDSKRYAHGLLAVSFSLLRFTTANHLQRMRNRRIEVGVSQLVSWMITEGLLRTT